MKFQNVKGTKDILPEEFRLFKYITDTAATICERYGFEGFSTPIFEYTEVFSRTLGDTSDVVNKEMYSFKDRKGRDLTLRPEFTACVVRSIISNGLQQKLPIKLFTTGPAFRYEQPQKGRYRQFHQINVEHIGSSDPVVDAEIIYLASDIIKNLGIKSTTLQINSIGDSESRKVYQEKLVAYLTKYQDELSHDSKIRLHKNPLRILDSKDETDRRIVRDAPSVHKYLNDTSKEFFDKLLQHLEKLGVTYQVNDRLVRGLDYYTHTVFEFVTDQLGAQSTVLAGGRYDNLIKQMGGTSTPAVGFGGGIERLMYLCDKKLERKIDVTVIVFEKQYQIEGVLLSNKIRDLGISAEVIDGKNINKAMKCALDNNSKFAIFIGEEEIKNGRFKLKNLASRHESTMSAKELLLELQR